MTDTITTGTAPAATGTAPAATGTAEANARLARDLYQASIDADLETLVALLHPEVVFHVPGTGVNAGDHRGHDGVVGFLLTAATVTEGTLQLEVHDVFANAERAVVLATYRARRPGRVSLENHLAHVLEIRDGLVVESWFHARDQYAVDAFWAEG